MGTDPTVCTLATYCFAIKLFPHTANDQSCYNPASYRCEERERSRYAYDNDNFVWHGIPRDMVVLGGIEPTVLLL